MTLFGLHPLGVLSALVRVLGLVAIRENHVLSDLGVARHSAGAVAFSLRARPEMLLACFRHLSALLLFCRRVLLRLMAGLSFVVVLVVIALLIHTVTADRELALSSVGIPHRGHWRGRRRPSIRHVRLLLQNAQLLFVGFRSLHGCLLITGFSAGVMRVMRILLPATSRHLGMSVTFAV